MTVATCRFCGDTCRLLDSVQYGKRHSAHVRCAVERKGPLWINGLRTWQLEMLPYGLVVELGLASVIGAELERRRHFVPPAQLRHNLEERRAR